VPELQMKLNWEMYGNNMGAEDHEPTSCKILLLMKQNVPNLVAESYKEKVCTQEQGISQTGKE